MRAWSRGITKLMAQTLDDILGTLKNVETYFHHAVSYATPTDQAMWKLLVQAIADLEALQRPGVVALSTSLVITKLEEAIQEAKVKNFDGVVVVMCGANGGLRLLASASIYASLGVLEVMCADIRNHRVTVDPVNAPNVPPNFTGKGAN